MRLFGKTEKMDAAQLKRLKQFTFWATLSAAIIMLLSGIIKGEGWIHGIAGAVIMLIIGGVFYLIFHVRLTGAVKEEDNGK